MMAKKRTLKQSLQGFENYINKLCDLYDLLQDQTQKKLL